MSRILVLEDEKDLRDVLEFNLKAAGHEVVATGDARAALGLARSERPDLILLDIMLPDVSGLDICRTLKSDAETRDIPVVMVTAKGEEIDRVVAPRPHQP